MEKRQEKEIERLWDEIILLQAENAALRRKLGEEYRDFSFYRNFCELDKVAEKDKLIKALLQRIEDLPFSTRTHNVLKCAQCVTLGDIARFDLIDLCKFRQFGKKCISEVKSVMEANNLKFGMDVDEIAKQALIKAGLNTK